MTPTTRRVVLTTFGLGVVAAILYTVLRAPAEDAQTSTSRPPTPESPAPTASAAPSFGPVTVKALTQEGKELRFSERRYAPEFTLELATNLATLPPADSPERALQRLYSAEAVGDLAAANAEFDPASRAKFAHDSAELKRNFLTQWKRLFDGQRYLLVRRVDFENYAIIYRRRADWREDEGLATIPTAFEFDGHRWWATTELAWHPVYGYDTIREGLDVRVVSY